MVFDTLRGVVRFQRLALSREERLIERAASVEDLRAMARSRLPTGVFDYIDGGAEDERTMRANQQAFARRRFRPRVLRSVGVVDVSATLLGRRIPLPLVLAPTGFTRMAHPDGELAVARAARRAGVPYTLSTMATRSIEEVASIGDGPRWFQVYVWRDRALMKDMLARAAASGYEAIVLTVDTAVLGRRERDLRRGFTLPPRIGPRTILDGMLHPRWTAGLLLSEPITFANLAAGRPGDGSTPVRLGEYISSQFDPDLSWDDLAWFREHWSGPIVLKGVQSVADAGLAADHGVEAIALSNHGGRQLDDAPASMDLVAPAAEAVDGRAEIICDGGIRRGSDIVKAVALGATACMVGRPYLYGLGAAGERGVDHVLQLLTEGVRRTMALVGARAVGDLGPDLVED